VKAAIQLSAMIGPDPTPMDDALPPEPGAPEAPILSNHTPNSTTGPSGADATVVSYGAFSPTDGDVPGGLFASARVQKAMGTYLPATVVFRLINFGRILIAARLMIKHQFGLMTMILLAVNVMTPLCSFGLAEAVSRYVPQHEARGSLVAFLRRATFLVGMFATVTVGLMLLFPTALGQFLYAQSVDDSAVQSAFRADAPALASASAVVIGLLVCYFFILAILKALRMFAALSVMETAHGALFFVFTVAALLLDMRSALTMTVVYAAALAIPITVMGGMLVRMLGRWRAQHGPMAAETSSLRSLVQFGFWTAIAGATWQILVYYPSWHLNKVHGSAVVAVFNAARQIGNLVLIGAMSVVAIIASTVTKSWESRGREAADRQWSLAFRAGGLGLFILCAGIALLKRPIMGMFGHTYADGALILPLQLLFFLMGAHLAFLAIHFQLIEKSGLLLWPWLVGVGANAGLAWWLASGEPAAVQRTWLWQTAGPILSHVFKPAWTDPMGLHAASWCGAFAIAASLATCLILMWVTDRRLDRGGLWVIGISALLATRGYVLGPATLVVMILTPTTSLFFNAAERKELAGVFAGALRQVPGLKRKNGA